MKSASDSLSRTLVEIPTLASALRLLRTPFARNTSILAGSTTLAHVIAVLAAPIITRLYRPDVFGSFELYLATLGLVVAVAPGRYEVAILLPESEADAAKLVSFALVLVALTSLISGAGLYIALAAGILPDGALELAGYLWILPLMVAAGGTYNVLSLWCVRIQNYSQIACSKIVQIAGQVVAQVSAALVSGGNPQGLLIGDCLGRTAAPLLLARPAWVRYRAHFSSLSWHEVWQSARRYRHFPLVSGWSVLLNTAGGSMPLFLVGGFYGSEALGSFALAHRVFSIPVLFIGQALSQVYMNEAARLARSDARGLQRLHSRLTKLLLGLGLIPSLFVAVLGPQLFSLVFGEAWRPAGVNAQLLAVMYGFSFATWPLIPTLAILERQLWQLWWDLGRVVVTAAVFVIAHLFGRSVYEAIASYSAAILAAQCLHLYLCRRAIHALVEKSNGAD